MGDDMLTAAQLLALDPTGEDLLQGVHNQDNRVGMLFGGQLLCQALAAAQATRPDWPVHSLQALFLRGGKTVLPVQYHVDRMRDGRRYAARRVQARQDGPPIFELTCSFHAPETGASHQFDLPSMPPPDLVQDMRAFAAAHLDEMHPLLLLSAARAFPVELRVIEPERVIGRRDEPRLRDYYIRMPSAAGIADPRSHQCLLAFMSDYWLANTVSAGYVGDIAVASLNHSLWFHAPVDVASWLLYRTESPWAGAGRGLARGLIYDQAGRLIASTAQEIQFQTGSVPA